MYKKKGQVANNIGAIITLIIGVGVAALVLIFVGALGGQVYEQVESDICDTNLDGCGGDGINNANVAQHIKEAMQSGFEALEVSGNYLPIIVLAVVIFIVLGLVTGMGGGARQYGGGAL